MVAPFVLLFVAFFVYPLVNAFVLSLQGRLAGQDQFVGLNNYVTALGDQAFWGSLGTVFAFAIVQAVTALLLGLVMALLLDSSLVRGSAFFRLTNFMPFAVPGVIATIMWGFLYSPQLNPLLQVLAPLNGGKQVNLLAGGNLVLLIANIVTWSAAGYFMTLYFSALTALPREMYEAAKLDGCNEFQLAIRVKVPALRPMILFTAILSVIGAMQLFNEPFLLHNLANVSASYTPNLYAYNQAFTYGNLNYAATLSFILALVTLVVSVVFFFVTSGESRRERRELRASRRASRPAPTPAASVAPRGV
ncbi:MAG: binding-protein-dependent transport system inner rane component [Amnibacterium sp.]|nr:binding-protein-dependent transport system inner rane component [Amnibacterium sp.]